MEESLDQPSPYKQVDSYATYGLPKEFEFKIGPICFGERVVSPDASDSNSQKRGFFVEIIRRTGCLNKGIWYRCTDGLGRFWECRKIVREAAEI